MGIRRGILEIKTQVNVITCDISYLSSIQSSLWPTPFGESLKNLQKDDLLAFGKHLELHVRAAIKVEEIRSPVSQRLVKEGVLKEPVSQNPTSSSDGLDLSEKYKYELELRKLEYEREGEREQRGGEREGGERQSKFELHRLEFDHALELKKLELAGRTDEDHPSMRPSSFDM